MAMTSVGLSPRHNVLGPSFRAIFRNPSKVDVNVFCCASSAAHAATDLFVAPWVNDTAGDATQYGVLFDTQKTSRQHDDIPRLGGKLVNEYA
jgi:hypothetical protein